MQESTVDEIVLIAVAPASQHSLMQLLSQLKPGFNLPIIVVGNNAAEIKGNTAFNVQEIKADTVLTPGVVYTAPADHHILFEKDNAFSLNGHNSNLSAMDAAFSTAADVHASSVICIALPGAYTAGSKGLDDIKNNGGITIAHITDTDAANEDDAIDMIMDETEMAGYLNEL